MERGYNPMKWYQAMIIGWHVFSVENRKTLIECRDDYFTFVAATFLEYVDQFPMVLTLMSQFIYLKKKADLSATLYQLYH